MQCRWCGVGGDLVGCDDCVSSFCESCIEQNLGKQHLDKVKKSDSWSCYSCDLSEVTALRWSNANAGGTATPSHTATNPLNLLERIKRLQAELPILQADCEQIAAKKKVLQEATTTTMVANRQAIA